MFKLVICMFVVASGVSGATIGRLDVTTEKREIVPLLSFETVKNNDGSFKFSYEGGDKSFREESAVVTDAGTEDEALEVTGSYRYIDDNGQLVEVHYTAGKNGFVPTGTNILSEISELAKAAANLPNYSEEQEREERLNQRRARSKTGTETETKTETKTEKEQKPVVEKKTSESAVKPKAAEPQVIPVKTVLEQKPVATEKLEKSDKVVSKTA